MCLAVPGEIQGVNGDRAIVDITGVRKEISTALIGEAAIGDYVLVHAGCAIAKIDEQEAKETLELLRQLVGDHHDI